MTNLNALRDLEKRLAEAKGPDREIDRAIAHAFERPWPGYKHTAADDNLRAPGGAWICQDGSTTTLICANEYTTSLDAAIALVERVLPGWFWTCGKCKLNAHATVGPDRDGPAAHLLADPKFDAGFDADMDHGVPALALCLAVTRALIAQGEQ